MYENGIDNAVIYFPVKMETFGVVDRKSVR